jgi:gliding motility-associated-like protein
VTITVNQPTQLTVSAAVAPTSVCVGTSATLTATVNGGTPTYNTVWMPGNLIGATQTVIAPTTTTYTVVVADANGCVDSATTTLSIIENPVGGVSSNIQSGCAPLCVNFTDVSTIAAPGVINSWTWDFGDGNTSTSQNPNHCYLSAGLYNVTLTVTTAQGCTNTIIMSNYINVFANPVAAFSATPQPTTELNPTIYFTDLSVGATIWNWSFGDLSNASSTQQNPVYTYETPTCYNVILEVSTPNGCTDTASQIICIDPDVSIYVPNAFTPNGDGTNDNFIPKSIGIDPTKYELWIFDRWGNMIFYTDDMAKAWDGTVQGGGGQICQIDTYVWKIKATDIMGKKHNLIGHVSIIR